MARISVPTLDDLQGKWRLVTVGRNGGKAPFFVPWLIKIRWQIDGSRYTKLVRGEVSETGRLALKPTTDHALLNELIETGDDAGQKHLGILRLNGRRLEHLQAEIGDPRPESFPYTKVTQANFAVFKRA
jgi:uncharacterized protein (TIGR03067 family)